MQRFCLHPASWGRTFDGPCAALRLDEELSNPNDLRGVKEKHIFIKEWIQGPVKEFVLRAACVEGNILINVSLLGRCVNICRDWADSALNIALGRIRRPPGSRGGGVASGARAGREGRARVPEPPCRGAGGRRRGCGPTAPRAARSRPCGSRSRAPACGPLGFFMGSAALAGKRQRGLGAISAHNCLQNGQLCLCQAPATGLGPAPTRCNARLI